MPVNLKIKHDFLSETFGEKKQRPPGHFYRLKKKKKLNCIAEGECFTSNYIQNFPGTFQKISKEVLLPSEFITREEAYLRSGAFILLLNKKFQ